MNASVHRAGVPVVDFDIYHSITPTSDPFSVMHALQQEAGGKLAWTTSNGGHWIATSGEMVREVMSDHERFSSSRIIIAATYRERFLPTEYDPPEHGPYRKLLIPTFLPKAMTRWKDEVKGLAIDLIRGIKSRDRCDFVADFAEQLPVTIFLRLVDVPLSDKAQLVKWVNGAIRPASEEARTKAMLEMNDYVDRLTDERLQNPRDDLFSKSLTGEVFGRGLTIDEARGLTRALLVAGLDTVAAVLGWIARFLAQNPVHRQRLIAEPRIVPKAVDELLRRFSVVNSARVVKQDMAYGGAEMKAGQQILAPTCMHGLDVGIWDQPMTVDFDRNQTFNHLAFGAGVHRCVGMPLALLELKTFIEEWLGEIPNFSLDPSISPLVMTGAVHGHTRLPLILGH